MDSIGTCRDVLGRRYSDEPACGRGAASRHENIGAEHSVVALPDHVLTRVGKTDLLGGLSADPPGAPSGRHGERHVQDRQFDPTPDIGIPAPVGAVDLAAHQAGPACCAQRGQFGGLPLARRSREDDHAADRTAYAGPDPDAPGPDRTGPGRGRSRSGREPGAAPDLWVRRRTVPVNRPAVRSPAARDGCGQSPPAGSAPRRGPPLHPRSRSARRPAGSGPRTPAAARRPCPPEPGTARRRPARQRPRTRRRDDRVHRPGAANACRPAVPTACRGCPMPGAMRSVVVRHRQRVH